eukprot:1583144-Amphidinium_carterae.1
MYESCFGGTGFINWTRLSDVEQQLTGVTAEPSRAKWPREQEAAAERCKSHFNPSTEALLKRVDGSLFKAFGYPGCCAASVGIGT